MLVVVEWLNSYLSEPQSARQIIDAMEAAGIEVEGAQHPPHFDDKIITAYVAEVKPHPDADKLRIAIVEANDTRYEVVCGAPNLQTGQHAVFAQEGASLPDGTKIKSAKIRGVTSHGMLCSEYELGLSSAHEGILDIGPEVPLNVPLHTVYDESRTVIDIKPVANRWDLQSYIGLAREVAAHVNAELIDEDTAGAKVRTKRSDDLFTNQVTEQVPCYGLVELRVKSKSANSPRWMQDRLRASGIKPVGLIVDVTNYVMLVTGQPLHAFDGKSVQGAVQVRFAKSNETLLTLDGVKRTLSSDDLVIADQKHPLALAGVIGGESTGITAKTDRVLLEAATFNGAMVRRTARRHGLRTEASARFERGIPMPAVKQALRRAVSLLAEYGDATVMAYQNEQTAWQWVQHVGVDRTRAQALLGVEELSRQAITEELLRLDFDAEPFDIAAQARKHLGKPYRFGANFRSDGIDAFDCSYLIDYLYSLIGVHVGHTALGQYQGGQQVETKELRPGDVVFIEGKIEKSATDHYFTSDGEGQKVRHNLDQEERVGHNGLYVGDGTVIMAAEYIYQDGEWVKRDEQGVIEVKLEEFTQNPGYKGARRYVDDLQEFVRVTVPWWRPDVRLMEDVLEELVKFIGLDQIPSQLPRWQPESVSPDTYWHRLGEIRHLLYGLGLHEVTTYPFISEADIARFRIEGEHLKLANARSSEQAFLRRSLLPLLTYSVVNNTTYKQNFGVFEQARVLHPDASGELPREEMKLGIVYKSQDILRIKSFLDQLFSHMHIDPQIVQTEKAGFLHPARQARLEVEGEVLGWFGMLHPEISQELKHHNQLLCAELDLKTLLRHWSNVTFVPPPSYPSSYRDITIRVAPHVLWQDVKTVLREQPHTRATFADEYWHEGRKALTIHLELLAHEATLEDVDIRERMESIRHLLERSLEAEVML